MSFKVLVTLDPIGSKEDPGKLGIKWKTVGSKVEIIFMQKLRLALKWKLIFMQKLGLGLKWKAVGSKVEIILCKN